MMTETLMPLEIHHLENNNDFSSLLKPVFDACDYNGDGFVKIQDLIELGQQHSVGNSEELEVILQQLDSNGDGRITFQEFTQRVKDLVSAASTPRDGIQKTNELSPVSEEQPSLLTNVGYMMTGEDEQRARSHTDSEGFFEEVDSESHSTTPPMNDYYGDHEDLYGSPLKHITSTPSPNYFAKMKQDTSIYSTYPPNGKRPKKLRKSLFQTNSRQLSRTSEYQSREEGFEAFGECNDSISSEPQGMYLSPSDGPASRPLSGKSAARQLRQTQSARASLHGSMEEFRLQTMNNVRSYSDDEADYSLLSEEISKLHSQLSLMQMDQEDHYDKQKRITEENKMLVNRINGLEELLQESKFSTQKAVTDESQRYRKELQKLQRDNTEHIDRLQMKLHEAELEIANLKQVEPMLRKEIECSLEERREAQRKCEELQQELLEKEKEIEQLKYKLLAKVDELEREKAARVHEVHVLAEEIENLKYMKSAALNQFDERNDLIKQLDILKKENDLLKSSKDDLRNQLFAQDTAVKMEKEHSLADELAHANRDDVLDALRAEETENHRLRQYIDQLLILIMQSDPLLLEK